MGYKLTKKEILKEVVRCGKDPNYFINNYARIPHPEKGLIPFKTYDFQTDLLEDFNDYRFSVILKARQLGISTIVAAYVAWLMLFHRDKNILVVATKLNTAANLVKKVKMMIKHMPKWLLISEISIDNRNSFELTNGSQVKASSTSGDAGRSEALSLLVIDEAAHIENLKELWTGLYPTISTGGRCIALSTPNGVGDWFHETYIKAESGQNEFHAVNLPWQVHPDRDHEWFEVETKNMSRRQIAQEYECNFNTSGDTVIYGEDITKLKAKIKEPKYRTGFDRNFWIWEEFQPEGTYLLVADVARGDGKDSSVFHIFKLETMEIIAEYQGKVTPDVFTNIVNDAGKEYGNAMVVVENNTVGFAVLEKLKEKAYPNLYHSIKSTHEYIDQVTAESHSSSVAGFTTSLKTRPLIIAKFEEFIRNKLLTIYSKRLVNELDTFIWRNGRAEAQRGYNDDLIMACAIGCWVRDTALVENQRDLEYKKAMIGSIMSSKTHIDSRIPGMKKPKHVELFEKAVDQRNTNKEFIWLLKG
mgnify:FL=1|tara:strand:+ start:6342 stop:7928 length:1587 start_codon:yes stop_codon:yes gene_type:complete